MYKNRRAEAEAFIAAQKLNGTYRPTYHLASPCGWINDPNGFIAYRGKYHLFYQFSPLTSSPGKMHWGHSVTEDFIHWEYVGLAISPDTHLDCENCWSGHAIEDDEGRLVAMYTALRPDGEGHIMQEPSVVYSEDGMNFVKPDTNPVLSAKDLPEDATIYDFRDPKIVRTEGGYYVIVANRGARNGRQLLYFTRDFKNWEYRGIFLEGIGDMPECPDLFRLDGKDIMITSVIGLPKDGLRFQSQHSDVIYLIGRIENEKFIPQSMEAVDLGPDFYAPQSIDTPDGRHVMVGWMQMWGEESPTHYLDHHWNGAMTIPRELWLQDGRLYQRPVRELENYRVNHQSWQDVQVKGEAVIEGLSGRRYEMDVELELNDWGQAEIRLLQTGDEYFRIHYDAGHRILTTDRSRCGWSMAPNNMW